MYTLPPETPLALHVKRRKSLFVVPRIVTDVSSGGTRRISPHERDAGQVEPEAQRVERDVSPIAGRWLPLRPWRLLRRARPREGEAARGRLRAEEQVGEAVALSAGQPRGKQRVPAARHTQRVRGEAGSLGATHAPWLGRYGVGQPCLGGGGGSHVLERLGRDDERPAAEQHHHHAPAALGERRHEGGVVAPQGQVQGVAACSGWGAGVGLWGAGVGKILWENE